MENGLSYRHLFHVTFFSYLVADICCRKRMEVVTHVAQASIPNKLVVIYICFMYFLLLHVCFVWIDEQVDKRAHHNALERKRRDHIKDSFSGLRDSVPSLQGEKVKLKCRACLT